MERPAELLQRERPLSRELRRRVNRRAWVLARKAYAHLRDAMFADVTEHFPPDEIENWQPRAPDEGG
jgi:hypothetical protein